MDTRPWTQEALELGQSMRRAARWLWREVIEPFFVSVGTFLVMAVPILLAMLVLWYLDHIGWRPGPGFYTIGALQDLLGPLA